MCALTALCSANCVVSPKQSERLQTGMRLRDGNAIITSKWKWSYNSDRKYRVNRRDFRPESCRWISMQTVAPFYPKCAISQTMKIQEKSVLQCNAKQNLILILTKKFDILVM